MDPTNRNTALASALAEELARCGVRRAVISPGSRSTPVALALWRQPTIEATVVLDERSAGFFALGCALATGIPAVAICTSGSAAANLHPAIAEADQAGVSLIALTADRPPELRDIGAGQTIDQLKLFGGAVRWFCEVGTHEADDAGLLHFRSVACRAFAAAIGDPRPGPVHLNVPWREPLAPIPSDGDVTATDPLALEGRGERPLTAVSPRRQQADSALLDELAERIASAPRGLIVAGRQPDPSLAPAATALAEASGYPILAEPTSQLRWGPHDRSALVGAYELIARSRSEDLVPELVLRFGELPTSKALRLWLGEIGGLRQVMVDPAGAWKEPTRRAESVVRADPVPFAAGLEERLRALGPAPDARAAWREGWLQADRAVRGTLDQALDGLDEPSEPGAWRALAEILEDGDVVLAASSMPVRDQELFLPSGPAQVRFVSNRGANGIDGLISTAAGVSTGSGARTWAVVGDLAFAHDVGGLRVAKDAEFLRLLVLDNAGGGIFHFLPQADALDPDEFEALLGTPSGIDIARVAQAHGLDAVVCESPDALRSALRSDARVVVLRVDRVRNLDLHRQLAEAAADALASA